jgi:hypothetical protein
MYVTVHAPLVKHGFKREQPTYVVCQCTFPEKCSTYWSRILSNNDDLWLDPTASHTESAGQGEQMSLWKIARNLAQPWFSSKAIQNFYHEKNLPGTFVILRHFGTAHCRQTECRPSECCQTECRQTKCRQTECRFFECCQTKCRQTKCLLVRLGVVSPISYGRLSVWQHWVWYYKSNIQSGDI